MGYKILITAPDIDIPAQATAPFANSGVSQHLVVMTILSMCALISHVLDPPKARLNAGRGAMSSTTVVH